MGESTKVMAASSLPTTHVDVAAGAPIPGRFPEAGAAPAVFIQHEKDLRFGGGVRIALPLRRICAEGNLDAGGNIMTLKQVIDELALGSEDPDTVYRVLGFADPAALSAEKKRS